MNTDLRAQPVLRPCTCSARPYTFYCPHAFCPWCHHLQKLASSGHATGGLGQLWGLLLSRLGAVVPGVVYVVCKETLIHLQRHQRQNSIMILVQRPSRSQVCSYNQTQMRLLKCYQASVCWYGIRPPDRLCTHIYPHDFLYALATHSPSQHVLKHVIATHRDAALVCAPQLCNV